MKDNKREISIVRSSAAEYLTFITATGEGDVNAIYSDENVWLTQKMMGVLYNVETNTINYHLKKIFMDKEVDENSVIRKFRITAADGKTYNTNHYNLSAIIAVGNKVDSPRAIQFRKWANHIIEEYTVKGFAMDDERLKQGGNRYFRELLQRIRDIRSSERNFYQQVTDIYATATDYDPRDEMTKMFFATVQNKLHYAVHENTAAEVIYNRVDNEKPFVGMTNFKGNYVTKDDVKIEPVASHKYLFTTSTCPNCRVAKKILEGREFEIIDAEKNPEMVKEFGIMQAPTLVITDGEHMTKYVNTSNIKKYVDEGL